MTSRTGLPLVEWELLRAVRDAPTVLPDPPAPRELIPEQDDPDTDPGEDEQDSGPEPEHGFPSPRRAPIWIRLPPMEPSVPPPLRWCRTVEVLSLLEERTGIGPRYGYPMLCDLVVAWRNLLPLLGGEGNFGSRDDPPADARYTRCGLSPTGAAAVAAATGVGPPLPLHLVNGSWYRGGTQPAFSPATVAAAVLAAAEGDPAAGARALGTPVDVGGCRVTGDLDRLLAGDAVPLSMTAPIRRERDGDRDLLVIGGLPPDCISGEVIEDIAARARTDTRYADYPSPPRRFSPLPVAGVTGESSQRVGIRLVLTLRPGADVEDTVQRLYASWWLRRQVDARLPAPAEQLLADWVAAHGAEQAAAGARVLADLPVPTRRWG